MNTGKHGHSLNLMQSVMSSIIGCLLTAGWKLIVAKQFWGEMFKGVVTGHCRGVDRWSSSSTSKTRTCSRSSTARCWPSALSSTCRRQMMQRPAWSPSWRWSMSSCWSVNGDAVQSTDKHVCVYSCTFFWQVEFSSFAHLSTDLTWRLTCSIRPTCCDN